MKELWLSDTFWRFLINSIGALSIFFGSWLLYRLIKFIYNSTRNKTLNDEERADLDKLLEKIEEVSPTRPARDIYLAHIYIEFCLHLTKLDDSEVNKKYIEKIQNLLYTNEDIDAQPKRKKTLNYYYGNIDLHIGMFNLYVKSNNNEQAEEHIQFALELNNLICNKFFQDIEKNQI